MKSLKHTFNITMLALGHSYICCGSFRFCSECVTWCFTTRNTSNIYMMKQVFLQLKLLYKASAENAIDVKLGLPRPERQARASLFRMAKEPYILFTNVVSLHTNIVSPSDHLHECIALPSLGQPPITRLLLLVITNPVSQEDEEVR